MLSDCLQSEHINGMVKVNPWNGKGPVIPCTLYKASADFIQNMKKIFTVDSLDFSSPSPPLLFHKSLSSLSLCCQRGKLSGYGAWHTTKRLWVQSQLTAASQWEGQCSLVTVANLCNLNYLAQGNSFIFLCVLSKLSPCSLYQFPTFKH